MLTILPHEAAEELKRKSSADAELTSYLTVLFTDLNNFTQVSEWPTPSGLVGGLNACFSAFDRVPVIYRIGKVITVGDAHHAVAGQPRPNEGHA